MMLNKKFNVYLASLWDKILIYDFAKEMYLDVKAPSIKSIRDRTLMKLLKSTAIMASVISTKFLSKNRNQLCGRMKLLLQEKQAGKILT